MRNLFAPLTIALALLATAAVSAESPDELVQPLTSPSIPAGPRPTATVTPLPTTPQPTATITPLPSASPSGTQPQTTNTMTPTPTPSATP